MGANTSAVELLARLYRLCLVVLTAPIILAEYFAGDTGSAYGVNRLDKLLLAVKMARNNRRIDTGSTFVEHLVVATKVLGVPPSVDGCLVECGCYKGGSTANLSLVAGACDRELHVFDSFEGMPDPDADDEAHVLVESGQVHTYEEGSWAATEDEARANVGRYGDPSVTTFHAGYFEETLPSFDRPVAAVFLDVGLRSSAATCLEHLWPLLVDASYLFTHEAKHVEIVGLFFDADWWRGTLGLDPPGLVGAGNGLGLHPDSNGFSSLLAYTVKNPDTDAFDVVAETGADNCVDASISGRSS